MIEVGHYSDAGHQKYEQQVGLDWIPCNLDPRSRCRMEDASVRLRLDDDHSLFVMADGHGSMEFFSESGDPRRPTVFVGGFECARFAVRTMAEYWHEAYARGHYRTNPDLGLDDMDALVHHAFEYVQNRLNQEFEKPDPAQSEIEGEAWKRLLVLSGGHPEDDPRCLVTAKKIVSYPIPGKHGEQARLPCWVQRNGHLLPCEYGCTLSMVLLRSSTGSLFGGHVGDTDIYLLKSRQDMRIRLTALHGVESEREIQRLQQNNMQTVRRHFVLDAGPFAKMYYVMPSRAVGHSLLRHHGICCRPSVFFETMKSGDLLVIGTDGFWESFARAGVEPLYDLLTPSNHHHHDHHDRTDDDDDDGKKKRTKPGKDDDDEEEEEEEDVDWFKELAPITQTVERSAALVHKLWLSRYSDHPLGDLAMWLGSHCGNHDNMQIDLITLRDGPAEKSFTVQ